MRVRATLALTVLVVLTACGAPAGSASLVAEVEFDPSQGMYIEGFLTYLRVTGTDFEVEEEIPYDGQVTIRVPTSGTYELEAWVRPCDGNCDALDLPTDRCDASVQLGAGEEVHLTVHTAAGQPCEIRST